MLWLVLLLVFYPFLSVTGINLTYIVRKDKNVLSPSCLAEDLERYAGIGWVYPIPKTSKELPSIATKFIPTITNEFNCKFSKNIPCNLIWSLRDWQIGTSLPKTKDVITDMRWEDLPTILISNTSKEFKERVELDNTFKQPFSLRAEGLVEIFICSGWNPYNYPCYYFQINYMDIYLNSYTSIPENVKQDSTNKFLEHSKASSNILSQDEWRNFIVSLDEAGLVQLIDANLDRILIEHTFKQPLTPMYMFMRSDNQSLWKIHQNSFMYTNSTQTSRLGPMLVLPTKDLCISMLVTMCSNCEFSFFYVNKTRKILKTVKPTKNEEWLEIKIKDENIQVDRTNLFVETKYINASSNTTGGFWAIDNVRVCNENEVRVSYLKLNNSPEIIFDDNISCQLIRKPSWRPKKLVYDQIKDFPEIHATSTTNSIRLTWASEEVENPITYFIFYQGNDICTSEPYNLERFKSNGFITTKLNEAVLYKLIPYTTYNVTISTVLHETDLTLFINTLETAEPTLEELPFNIKIKAQDTSINVTWQPVDCFKKYGRLVYTLIVTNTTLNFSKEISLQTDTSYQITGLQPYTHYTLTILTARNGRNLHNKIKTSKFTIAFTTMAGVAPMPDNLEIYSMDRNSASLRYDLPTNSNGVIRDIQVNKCNSMSANKCKSQWEKVSKCNLWPNKYCVDANYLQPFQSYTFRVSLKNLDTPAYGKEAIVKGYASERIPGKPTNITYKIVDCHSHHDYCHLNVTWLHPYYQNGTITEFDIVLNSTNTGKSMEDDRYIHEVYYITNNTYYYDYTYQIKYLPYSSYYNLYLQSGNTAYKSETVEVNVKTDNLGDHIDQNPKLIAKSDSTLLFKAPHLDSRLKFYTLSVVVQDFDRKRQVDDNVLQNKKIANNLCNKFGDTWISQVIKVDSNKTENIMIGNAEKERLKPNTQYCITFIITNQYKGSEHDVVYYEKITTTDAQISPKEVTEASSSSHLYMLLLILLIIPIGFLIYRYFRKKRYIKSPMLTTNEHCYETLPCDEIRHKDSETTAKLQSTPNKTYS